MLRRLTLVSRLTILYALISALVLCGLGVVVARATYAHFVDLDIAYLQGKASLVQRTLAQTSDPSMTQRLLDQQMDSHEGLYIGLGSVVSHASIVSGVDFSPLRDANIRAGEPFNWQVGDVGLRGIKVSKAQGESLLLALDTRHHTHFMTQLHYTLAGYLLFAAVLSGWLGWWAARRGLAPLRIMHERFRVIDSRQLSVRIPTMASSIELAELGHGLNLMLERLEKDFERLSEFSSDLAHELRTPITNLMTQTQVTLTRDRDVDAYRDVLASNAEEFQRLARMVSDMLYLAKTEHGLELPNREPVDLEREVQALFDFYEVVAEEADVKLALSGEATVIGDRLMIQRAIGNLLSNALHHAIRDSVLEVSIVQLSATIELSVVNEGKVIDPLDIPRLFDRFFRTEKSRQHPAYGGAGLGLSITQSLMVAHGGTIRVRSDQKNTSFTLVFPA